MIFDFQIPGFCVGSLVGLESLQVFWALKEQVHADPFSVMLLLFPAYEIGTVWVPAHGRESMVTCDFPMILPAPLM